MIENKEPRLGRLVTAMVTAFDEDLEVDVDRTVELGERIVEGGSDSLLVMGTTGENPTITEDDRVKVFSAMASAMKGTAPVIANVGSNCTAASVEFAKRVAATGVDALMLVVPYYNKPPQEGLYLHFKTVADSVDLPIVLYNIPGRTSRNMEAETTLRLARDCDNIVAVKEASGDLVQIDSIIDDAPADFSVYSGDDALTYEVMKLGGTGVISTTSNVAPAQMKELVRLLAKRDIPAARAAQKKLLPLMRALFAAPNPIMVKQALDLAGFSVGGVRLPLVEATPEQADRLEAVMRQTGVL